MASQFKLTMEDGTVRAVTCDLDPDRHTSVYVRSELQRFSTQLFGDSIAVREFRQFHGRRGR